MNTLNHIDKSKVSSVSLHDESDEKEYWLKRTPEERLLMVETLRQRNFGYAATSKRLQRILTVVEFPQSGKPVQGG